jgi:hypothetical protein
VLAAGLAEAQPCLGMGRSSSPTASPLSYGSGSCVFVWSRWYSWWVVEASRWILCRRDSGPGGHGLAFSSVHGLPVSSPAAVLRLLRPLQSSARQHSGGYALTIWSCVPFFGS